MQTIKEKITQPLEETQQLHVILQNIIKAREHLKNTRKNAYDLRQEFLWQQALAEEIAGNIQASKHFKQLSRIEAIVRKFKKLRKYFSHKLSSQTKNIAIKDTNNEWVTIDDPKK